MVVYLMNENKINSSILATVGYYLPGYKAGGALRSIANMVDVLGDEFDFSILTRSHDLGEVEPYKDLDCNQWVKVGKSEVLYSSGILSHALRLFSLIRNKTYNAIYLNSFFDARFTLLVLLFRLFLHKSSPVILAPRGEFSKAALEIKNRKKKVYLAIVRKLSLTKGVIWQASSSHEAEDIRILFPDESPNIVIARDLPCIEHANLDFDESNDSNVRQQDLRVIFLSRIAPVKNLDFALSILSEVTSKVKFDIYGPIEDNEYWEHCQSLIDNLPSNIVVEYRGAVEARDIVRTFRKYDLFLFPTRGENYGHVIAESLMAGTPVLISDQTMWKTIDDLNLGWQFPLCSPSTFAAKVQEMADSKSLYTRKSKRSEFIRKAKAVVMDETVVEESRYLFHRAISKR